MYFLLLNSVQQKKLVIFQVYMQIYRYFSR